MIGEVHENTYYRYIMLLKKGDWLILHLPGIGKQDQKSKYYLTRLVTAVR